MLNQQINNKLNRDRGRDDKVMISLNPAVDEQMKCAKMARVLVKAVPKCSESYCAVRSDIDRMGWDLAVRAGRLTMYVFCGALRTVRIFAAKSRGRVRVLSWVEVGERHLACDFGGSIDQTSQVSSFGASTSPSDFPFPSSTRTTNSCCFPCLLAPFLSTLPWPCPSSLDHPFLPA